MRVIKKNKEITDSELLAEYISNRNLEVLGLLYNRYTHLVYGVCLKYLKNREESQDAVIKIFESLITEIPKFEIQNFKSWLYVVTKNFCLMHIRKRKTEKKHFEKFSDHFFMESTENMHPIDEAPESNLEDKLKNCIEKLKQEQQKCIVLFYYEQRCYKEIASLLNIEEMKVKSYIQNGKRNLKICLENHQEKSNA